MAYQETLVAAGIGLNNVSASTILAPSDQVLIGAESSPARLVLTLAPALAATVGNYRWVLNGQFHYIGAKYDLSQASGAADSASAFLNDTLVSTVSFGRPFDVRQLIPTSPAQASSQLAYRLGFLSGNDVFTGARTGTAQDQVQGLDGSDSFAGYGGTDSFDGGNGRDTAIFRGRAFEYTVSLVGNQRVTVRDNVGQRDDTDTLANVERLQFSDFTIALDTTGVAGKAYRLYKAAFNRQPDLSGLGFWIDKMDGGMDLIDVSLRFIDSAEFRAMYGNRPTNEVFLTGLYNHVLQRAPDNGGYQWWLNQLSSNPQKTWQKVLADFSESAENQANVAQLIASGIAYDPPG